MLLPLFSIRSCPVIHPLPSFSSVSHDFIDRHYLFWVAGIARFRNIIHDNYPKFIITLDEDPETDYEGVRIINALDWLLRKTGP
jgi:hypothetical protein